MTLATLTIALNTTDDASGRWVHLTPTGAFTGRDGRKWKITDADRVIRATTSRQGDTLPVDYEHQTDFAPKNGQPAPAAGWIKALEARADGIWGRVQWTPKAAEHLAACEYRYLSPVISHRPDGEVMALLRAPLTNNPNLELTALARVKDDFGDGLNMETELRTILGLGADASTSDMLNVVRKLAEQESANSAAPDPAQWVPMSLFMKATEELHLRNQGMTEALALNRVEQAIEKAQVFPFMKEWAVSLCRFNPAAFEEFLSTTRGGADLLRPIDNRRPLSADAGLSDVETAVARTLGHTAEELRAHTKGKI